MKPSVKPKSKVCKKVYIAFFIIIILMISSEMIRQSLSEKHVEYSSVINKAGKQRMLSQSIAKNISLNIPYSNFKSQIEQLKINHEYLKSGMDLPISFNQKINKEYITVDKHLLNIDKAIGCYIENTCNDVKSRKKLIESFDLLTKEVDAIVNLISLNVTKSFKDLRKINDKKVKQKLKLIILEMKEAKFLDELSSVKKLAGHPNAFRMRVGT